MANNTQILNMNLVDQVFDLYMVEVSSKFGISVDDMKRLWQPRREELAAACGPKTKRKRKRSSGKQRSKSAYMFFCAEMRKTLKEEQPELKGRAIMSELGKRWKQAKAGDTSKWDELAKQDKARVEAEEGSQKEATPRKTKKASSSPKKKAAKKASSSPKKAASSSKKKAAKSAYLFFCAEMRPKIKAKNPEMTAKDVMVALGKAWKEAKASDTSKWDELAKQDKARYQEEENIEQELTEEELKEKGKKQPKKKKKRVYPYNFWAKMHRSEISKKLGIKGKELTQNLREQWKALSKDEKAEWREAAINAQD